MNSCVVSFQLIDKTKRSLVGGKGANLGELFKIEGIRVPEGFCVTTEAYRKMTVDNEELNNLLDELSHLRVEDKGKVSEDRKSVV